MKSLYLLLISLFVFSFSKAQNLFEVTGAVASTYMTTKVDNKKDEGFKPSTGYSFAAYVNIPAKKHVMLQVGLQYESYHFKIQETFYDTASSIKTTETINSTSHIDYISVPIRLWYIAKPDKGFRVGFGNAFGFGIAGKTKTTDVKETSFAGNTNITTTNSAYKIKFGTEETKINSLNLSLGFNVAYLFANRFLLGAYANFGIRNLCNTIGVKQRLSAVGVNVGYSFYKRKKAK